MTQDNNSFSMAQVEEFEQEINRILQTHYPLDGLIRQMCNKRTRKN